MAGGGREGIKDVGKRGGPSLRELLPIRACPCTSHVLRSGRERSPLQFRSSVHISFLLNTVPILTSASSQLGRGRPLELKSSVGVRVHAHLFRFTPLTTPAVSFPFRALSVIGNASPSRPSSITCTSSTGPLEELLYPSGSIAAT